MSIEPERRPMETGEPQDVLRLWPGAAPGSEDWTHDEYEEHDPVTSTRSIRAVVVPTLTPVLPPPALRNGTAVVVAPGGAFTSLAWEHEGTPMARWLAARGFAAFLLKYRLLRVPTDPAELAALAGTMPEATDAAAMRLWMRRAVGSAPDIATADGEQSVRKLREHASRYGLDPKRIGILGFSAGGTVALQTGATTDPTARPDFVVNVYGAFLERQVPAAPPPYFGALASDDRLCRDHFFDATRSYLAAGSDVTAHVYGRGGHGFALTPLGLPVDTWTDRLAEWLAARGLS